MKNHPVIKSVSGLAVAFLLTLGSPAQAQSRAKATVKSTNQFIVNPLEPTNMDNQAAQTVRTFLTAVQQGDQQTLAALLHPDIQWNQPGSNRFSGAKSSSTAVFQMVGGMFAATANTLSLADIKQLAVNGNKVACLIRWKAAQPGGGVLDVDNIDVYTVENGKITEAMIYSEDIAQEDYFWGK